MSNPKDTLRSASAADGTTHRPEFFRLVNAADRACMDDLLQRQQVTVMDHIHGQLRELVKTLDPTVRLDDEALSKAAWDHLGSTPAEDYGVWVFYPWNGRLIHILDEDEFKLVRTDRNRNKITREEQAMLATKKVGVIGLSVGQSVSMAMVMERSFGELRLADFDTLELSNLNRIRSGLHNLGGNKVVNTAREIAEIDPYLKVTCFTEGITPSNLERFCTEGGVLDLLVDECDDVVVKILARQQAKALSIPVVMDTSDRGLIDVERFDLEPNRPIMHGFLEKLDLSVIHGDMPSSQKVNYIMAMVDSATLSDRMKASLPEIGKGISPWPQLGGHVMFGGAMTADVIRKVLLRQMEWSGRWWVDLDGLLTEKTSAVPSRWQ
ncbi:MAG TPA: ThiF family adenylyltransferase [Flavobacteriales bacterium]|nr:ThiF family adenylyltransferase [Flavobacteriales bacterium]